MKMPVHYIEMLTNSKKVTPNNPTIFKNTNKAYIFFNAKKKIVKNVFHREQVQSVN
jgi:hypothetical protein